MTYTLYAPEGYSASAILFVAEKTGVEVKHVKCDSPEAAGPETTGLLPILRLDQGDVFGTTAICRFLARARADCTLYGTTLQAESQVDTWVAFCTKELEIPVNVLALCEAGFIKPKDAPAKKATDAVSVALSALDTKLSAATYVTGAAMTLADVMLALVLAYGVQAGALGKTIAQKKNVTRWLEDCKKDAGLKKLMA
jgi:glutathione S-transferase